MFCQKCGFKLIEGEEICSNCGDPAVATDSCGGFWGLVTQMDSAPSGPPPQNELREKTRPLNVPNNTGQTEVDGMNRTPNNYNSRGVSSGANDKLSGTSGLLVIVSLALAFISFVICLVLLISLGKTKNALEELSEKIDANASSDSNTPGDEDGSSIMDLVDNATDETTEETTEDTTEDTTDVAVVEVAEGTLTFELIIEGIDDDKDVDELNDITIRVYNDDFDATYNSATFDKDGKYIAVIDAGEYKVSVTGDGSNDKYEKDTILLNGSPSAEKSVTIEEDEDTEFPITITYKESTSDKDSKDSNGSQDDKTSDGKDSSSNPDDKGDN